ncbi:tetratricopeptide repeat protein [Kitasatospora sp. NPDC101235]|uniref:tetratricopeptide repeat protein n=1 Tax=Kitasatospora sp. NPDC101235 TaxID=3364101 RepID=UPI0037FF98FE
MSGEPTIDWEPQYQGADSNPQAVECYERFVTTLDAEWLATLKGPAQLESTQAGDLHALASAYLVAGRPAEAVPLLEFLVFLEPEEPGVRCDLAYAYARIGSADRASRELERVLAAHPGWPAAVRQLADVRAWLLWHEDTVDLLRQQADVFTLLTSDGAADTTQYLALAKVLYQLATVPRSGVDWPDVVSVLERAHHLDGDHEQVLELLAAASHHAGAEAQWHAALSALERVAPGSEHLDHWRSVPPAVAPNPDRLLAIASSETADAHGALRDLRSDYRTAPNNPDIQRCLVQAEAGLGNVAEALWLAEGLAATDGLDFYAHGALMTAYGIIGDGRARRHLAAALELAPDQAERAELLAQYDALSEG